MLKVYELSKSDLNSEKLKLGRDIFMNYFLDLYKSKSSEILQIKTDTKTYLNKIFDTTEKALKSSNNLYAILIYFQDQPIGFSTFGPLENKNTILIRTLPIDSKYKKIEFDIRNKIIIFVQQKFPNTKEIVIMVRKANIHHQELCLRAGFIKDEFIFDKSSYIKKTYDSECYFGYLKFVTY